MNAVSNAMNAVSNAMNAVSNAMNRVWWVNWSLGRPKGERVAKLTEANGTEYA